MSQILKKREIAPGIFEFEVEAPQIAAKALPGHFVIVMPEESGERIPLTIGDSDPKTGTITLVMMIVGVSTQKLSKLKEGTRFYALLGPLGHPSQVERFGTVLMVAGGVGAAPIHPIAKKLKQAGNKVITIHGAKSANLLFWEDKLRACSDEYTITTDDGSKGIKGLVTGPLKKYLENDRNKDIQRVYAIGPTIMMKVCSETTRPFGVQTIVSLNNLMVDGTGMCGGCRVKVGDKTLFTCTDGPEFDGHQVDWSTVLSRGKIYAEHEKCSWNRCLEQVNK
jgi:ferredoxin/flavodoxin---NADP+ reductase